MDTTKRSIATLFAATLLFSMSTGSIHAQPSRADIQAAMLKVSDYMVNTVSTHGGFVEKYREDLSKRWGEVPARESMIWVQSPGTVSVGRTFLEAYRATGEERFLRHAEKAANALIWGQHPSGGWHYFIDFDASGTAKWYEEVGANCWGWEEFYHYYDNCTFDDNVTIGATEYLLDLYMETLDRSYRVPLLKAIDFVLESQYPNGGWPQRYPTRFDRGTEHDPGYTTYYTYNDSVIIGNIFFLLKAYRLLGDAAYREAAIRGMDFVVISQQGTPQAGWGQQYDMQMRPAGARNFEPGDLAPSTTVGNMRNLMRFYKITGDRKYLRGIPDAIEWLENSKLPPGHSDEGRTHAQFVELGTNKPLYAHREGTSRWEGRYWVDYEPGNFPGHYGMQLTIDIPALQEEYERVFNLSPEEAKAEYQAQQEAKPPSRPKAKAVEEIIGAMDGKGAWIEDLSAPDYTDWKFKPREEFRGISTRTFSSNMRTLTDYVRR